MRSFSHFLAYFSPIFIICAIVGLIFWVVSCSVAGDNQLKDACEFKFSKGDVVQTVVDGRRGMVVGLYYNSIHSDFSLLRYEPTYNVRFGGRTDRTNTRTISSDKEIEVRPYATVRMQEFEIQELNK